MATAPLPSSLLTRLQEDSTYLATPTLPADLPSATRLMREHAQRKLLHLTPTALNRLGDLVASSDEKVSLGAISKVLDKSPATQSDISTLASEALPPEAIEALASALASFASAAASHLTAASASQAAPIIATATIIEES